MAFTLESREWVKMAKFGWLVNRFLCLIGIQIIRFEKPSLSERLNESAHKSRQLQLDLESREAAVRVLEQLPWKDSVARRGLSWISETKSQLGQDIFALLASGFKQGGFFVDVGASDGITLSNSFLLQEQFNWKGILIEPEVSWHPHLESRRSESVIIEKKAVFNTTGEHLRFLSDGVLSTLEQFKNEDMHVRAGIVTIAETISLAQLLRDHRAPKWIDFLSLDTEGSEWSILENFPWNEYKFGAICVEHNWNRNMLKISKLLERKSYLQVGEKLSRHDSWFLHSSNFDSFEGDR